MRWRPYKSDLGAVQEEDSTDSVLSGSEEERGSGSLLISKRWSLSFDWRNDVMLEDVEQFRQEYASHYGLHEFAMMVAQVRPGSFIVTWFVPESVVEKLKGKVPRAISQEVLCH